MLKPVVKQSVLRAYLRRLNDADTHREALREAEALVTALEVEITKLLEDGAAVEPGKCKALLTIETGARRPPWKDIYLDHMVKEHEGRRDDEEAGIIANCQPKTKQVLIVSKT